MSQKSSAASRRNTPATDPVHDAVWEDAQWRSGVRRRLMRWYRTHARDLPWRRDPAPYRVWISEIMLQQTQVATVVPYYERFLTSFPTVAHLAEADEADLMAHWEGLGYYRRARSMHAAAKKIVDEHGGVFPETYDEVLALPGIGRYTAGAILSISRDRKLPILEGNTQRVFSRWVAMRDASPQQTHANKLLWRIAEAMLPGRGAGTFNQAAMELGATLCTPRQPQCERCPVAQDCAANARQLQQQIPGKVKRIVYEDRDEYAFIVCEPRTSRGSKASVRSGAPRYLMRQLPPGGRWAGLWDFPRSTHGDVESAAHAAAQLSQSIGVPLEPVERVMTIKHAVTKYRIRLHVHSAACKRAAHLDPSSPWVFVSPPEMSDLPMSVTARRIARHLRETETSP